MPGTLLPHDSFVSGRQSNWTSSELWGLLVARSFEFCKVVAPPPGGLLSKKSRRRSSSKKSHEAAIAKVEAHTANSGSPGAPVKSIPGILTLDDWYMAYENELLVAGGRPLVSRDLATMEVR